MMKCMESRASTILRGIGRLLLGMVASAILFVLMVALVGPLLDALRLSDGIVGTIAFFLILLVPVLVMKVHLSQATRIWRNEEPIENTQGKDEDRVLCIRCGYNLQGNPRSCRCPECGKIQYIWRVLPRAHRGRKRGQRDTTD